MDNADSDENQNRVPTQVFTFTDYREYEIYKDLALVIEYRTGSKNELFLSQFSTVSAKSRNYFSNAFATLLENFWGE